MKLHVMWQRNSCGRGECWHRRGIAYCWVVVQGPDTSLSSGGMALCTGTAAVGLFRGGQNRFGILNLKSHFMVTFSPYKEIHVTWSKIQTTCQGPNPL